MIKKIRPSQLDKDYVKIHKYSVKPIGVNLNNVVVTKPWGYEYLMFKNPETEIWNLSIKYQRSTSMHCHPKKKTALIVLSGRALFSTLNESWELMPHDVMIIDKGTFHSTQSLSKEGLVLLEFENPPMKHDLLRLEDKYGRARKGYEEEVDRMMKTSEYPRFLKAGNKQIKNICNNKICLIEVKNREGILNYPQKNRTLAVVLSGVIKSKLDEPIYEPPHVLALEELQETGHSFHNVSLMLIR
jgi:mannose-6-phosphate isomerase-like protein (cupin superfamily)